MIKYIFYGVVLLTIITLYLGVKTGRPNIFQRLMNFFLLTALLNAAYRLLAESFLFPAHTLHFLPFAFAYGPLLYLALRFTLDIKPTKREILGYFIPFLLVFVVYIINLFEPEMMDSESNRLIYHLGIVIMLFIYAFKILFTSPPWSGDFKKERRLINQLGLLMLIVAVVISILVFTKAAQQYVSGSFVPQAFFYALLLTGVFLVFSYTIGDFQIAITEDEINASIFAGSENLVSRYQKSALSEGLLDVYQQKLDFMMSRELAFLDPELSLQSLSKQLKIPKHHLTQLFNVRLGENFYHYINKLRIDYACELIRKSNEDSTFEEIGYKSGFNSKTSFNRYFKKQVGCTPSTYRTQ